MSDELKGCPFCGQPPSRVGKSYGLPIVCCGNVHCTLGGSDADWYEPAAWNLRPIEDALRARAEAAEQRAEAWRRFAQEVASDVHPIGADPLGDITTDFLPVLLDITRRAAQQHGAATARAEAAEQRAAAAEAEVAQARAEGAAAERARIAADLREWAEQGGDPWMAHVADEVAAERRPGGDQ